MSGTHPTAVVSARHEPVHPPLNYPQWSPAPGIDEAVPTPESRPLPVEQTQFWAVGRTYTHAHAHTLVQQQLAIPEWLSVQAMHFLPGMRAIPGSVVAWQSVGAQNPISERVNIHRPDQVKLSDLSEVARVPSVPLDPSYLKLL